MKRSAASQQWKILKSLEKQPMTDADLAPILGISKAGVMKHTRQLRKQDDKRIFISGFLVNTSGRPAPIYALGDKPDAEYAAKVVRKPRQPDRKEARRKQVFDALLAKPRTAEEVGELVHLSTGAARGYIREMRSATPKQAYIKSWRHPGHRGDLAPVYALGDKPDAIKPKQTRAQRYAKEKGNPDSHARMLAKKRREYWAKKAKPKAAHWAAVLGV